MKKRGNYRRRVERLEQEDEDKMTKDQKKTKIKTMKRTKVENKIFPRSRP
jgi:hypothetical protein